MAKWPNTGELQVEANKTDRARPTGWSKTLEFAHHQQLQPKWRGSGRGVDS